MTPLPKLQVGQIWQCLDQTYTVKIERSTTEDVGDCFIGTIMWFSGHETGRVFIATPRTNEAGEPCYVRRADRSPACPSTLMRLLYAPTP